MSPSRQFLHVLAFVVLSLSQTTTAGPLRPVAVSMLPVSAPQIDAQGKAAFEYGPPPRIVAPNDISSHERSQMVSLEDSITGIYYERQFGVLDPVIVASDLLPGVEQSAKYSRFQGFEMNPRGDIAVKVYLTGPDVNPSNIEAIFAFPHDGRSRLVFRSNQQLPTAGIGSDLANFRLLPSPMTLVDGDGFVTQLVFPAASGDSSGRILQEQAGGAALFDRLVPVQAMTRGTPETPATPVTLQVTTSSISNLSGAIDGGLVFTANLVPPANHNTNFRSARAIIKTNAAGQLEPVIHAGDPVDNTAVSSFQLPVINSAGDVASVITTVGPSATRAILRETAGKLSIAARGGDSLPLLSPSIRIGSIANDLRMNNRGDVLFLTSLVGVGVAPGNNNGIFVDRPGEGILPFLRQGDQAPGTEVGTRFGIPQLTDVAINNVGQAAFYARLTNTDTSRDAGIWAFDMKGELQLIVREGDLLNVSSGSEPADLRRVATLLFYPGRGNASAYGTGFNDSGQLAFRAQFTDGTYGIFVSNAVAIPEPATIAILLLGIAAAIGLRKPSHRI